MRAIIIITLSFILFSCNMEQKREFKDSTSNIVEELVRNKNQVEDKVVQLNKKISANSQEALIAEEKYSDLKTAQNSLISKLIFDIETKNYDNNYDRNISEINQKLTEFVKYANKQIYKDYPNSNEFNALDVILIATEITIKLYEQYENADKAQREAMIKSINECKIKDFDNL